MELDKLNRWLSLASNMGVIASIVLLAIELHQNDATLKEMNRISVLDARALELQQYNDFRTMLVETPGLQELWTRALNGEQLPANDEARFITLCTNYVWMSATAWERSVALGRQVTADHTVRIRGEQLRDSPGFRRCWQANRAMVVGYGLSEYATAVEAVAGR